MKSGNENCQKSFNLIESLIRKTCRGLFFEILSRFQNVELPWQFWHLDTFFELATQFLVLGSFVPNLNNLALSVRELSRKTDRHGNFISPMAGLSSRGMLVVMVVVVFDGGGVSGIQPILQHGEHSTR
jgi:hypothetical protein